MTIESRNLIRVTHNRDFIEGLDRRFNNIHPLFKGMGDIVTV
jgi:hypothetical protein